MVKRSSNRNTPVDVLLRFGDRRMAINVDVKCYLVITSDVTGRLEEEGVHNRSPSTCREMTVLVFSRVKK